MTYWAVCKGSQLETPTIYVPQRFQHFLLFFVNKHLHFLVSELQIVLFSTLHSICTRPGGLLREDFKLVCVCACTCAHGCVFVYVCIQVCVQMCVYISTEHFLVYYIVLQQVRIYFSCLGYMTIYLLALVFLSQLTGIWRPFILHSKFVGKWTVYVYALTIAQCRAPAQLQREPVDSLRWPNYAWIV